MSASSTWQSACSTSRLHSKLTFVPHEEVYGLGIEDVLHREPAIEKINGAIGWRPSLDLDRILADVIEHTRRAPAVEVA